MSFIEDLAPDNDLSLALSVNSFDGLLKEFKRRAASDIQKQRQRDAADLFRFYVLNERIRAIELKLDGVVNTSPKDDDVNDLGGLVVSEETLLHNYIHVLEARINALERTALTTINQLNALETVVHTNANALLDLATASNDIVDYLSGMEASMSSLIDKAGADEKASTIDSAVSTANAVVGGIAALGEWIPAIGNLVTSVKDYVTGAITLAGTVEKKIRIAKVVITGFKYLKNFTHLMSFGKSKTADPTGLDAIKANITRLSLSIMNRVKLEAVDDSSYRVSERTISYYVIPISVADIFRSISKQAIEVAESMNMLSYADTCDKFPAHAFLTVTENLSPTWKREVIFSTGSFIDGNPIANLIKGSNFSGYSDRLCRKVGSTWQVVWEKRTGDTNAQIIKLEEAKIIKSHKIHSSYNVVISAMECMIKNAKSYNPITYNCQTQCLELISFYRGLSRPSWFGHQCAADMSRDELVGTYSYNAVHDQYGAPRVILGNKASTDLTITTPGSATARAESVLGSSLNKYLSYQV